MFVCFSWQSPWRSSDHKFYLFCGWWFFFLVQFSVFAKLLWVSAAHVRFRDEPGTYTASYTVRRIPFSSSLLSRIPHTLIFSVRAPLSKQEKQGSSWSFGHHIAACSSVPRPPLGQSQDNKRE